MHNSLISIFDTSIAAYNIGNQIIMDAVRSELLEIFSQSRFINLPVEDIKKNTRHYNRISQLSFVGGTNILNSDIRKYRQWDLSLHNVLILRNIILMGCGWFQYESNRITTYTRWALNKILTAEYTHSVRDNYTKNKLELIGIKSINTGCPTLWKLTPQHVSQIPPTKSDSVVFTITDYNKDFNRDRILLSHIMSNYKNIFMFPQGTGDEEYLSQLGNYGTITIINPQLDKFNNVLQEYNADYIGTRLHAGIRALQLKRRSLIIGIDNRALEMAKDFRLPVINAKDINSLGDAINQQYHLSLDVPFDNIKIWKNQF